MSRRIKILSLQPYDKPLVLRSSFAGFPTKPVNFYEFMTNHMIPLRRKK